MSTPLDLEVVIVSHGAEGLLRRCLRSLRDFPATSGSTRVTVVDSGSPDATPEMVNGLPDVGPAAAAAAVGVGAETESPVRFAFVGITRAKSFSA